MQWILQQLVAALNSGVEVSDGDDKGVLQLEDESPDIEHSTTMKPHRTTSPWYERTWGARFVVKIQALRSLSLITRLDQGPRG